MPAGRPRAVNKEEVHSVLENNVDEVIRDGKVVVPSALIWETLLSANEKLRFTSSKAFYNEALRWWREKKASVDDEQSGSESCISIETSIAESSSQSSIEKSKPSGDVKFSIQISKSNWQTIQPVPAEYHRKFEKLRKSNVRKYLILPPGIWTSFIVDAIAKHPKDIVCNVVLKRGNVYATGDNYIVMTAKCATCNASLIGVVKKEPSGDFKTVKIEFVLKDFDESRHRTSRKNVKNYGASIRSQYDPSKSANAIHLANANKTMKMFEPPKGRSFSSNAVRCGQYRTKVQNKLSTCPYTSLSYMKHSKMYAESIHMIIMEPFCVMYSSPNQMKLYKAYHQRNNGHTKISCDATGGVVNKLGMYIST